MAEFRDDASARVPEWDGDCLSAARDRQIRGLGPGEGRRRLGNSLRAAPAKRSVTGDDAEQQQAAMFTPRRPGMGRRQR